MTRRRSGAASAVALVVLSSLLLSGCVPPSGGDSGGGGGDTDLYMGDLPAPAELPPAVDGSDDATAMQTAYDAIQALAPDAHAGGEKGVAAWEALFLRAGIPIEADDGSALTANGDQGLGMLMSDGELRLA
ncbi:hypothetical protein FJ656_20700, partial [Schumannella luteola]